MKAILLTLLFIQLNILNIWAQPAPIKWGKIDKKDFEMTVYPEDPEASAVVLADYGDAYFRYHNEKGFQLNVERITRIKILNKTALKHANQQILLYHKGDRKEEVVSLKGMTYSLEGGKIEKAKMENDQVFDEVYNDHFNIIKFTLPNVKEGCIIEFKYTLKSDFIYNLHTWEFQRDIPVVWSEFRARVPEYFYYKTFMSGFLPIDINEEETYTDSFNYKGESLPQAGGQVDKYSGTLKPLGKKYRWAVKNVPALKEEAFITTIRDYLSKIEFELSYTKYPGQVMNYFSSSWEKLNEEFLNYSGFGKQLERARYMQDDLAQILQGVQDEEEKAAKVVQFFKQHFRYNGRERVYTENNLRKVYQEKNGNSAEINLLLVLMLREAGLQANPVILSTRQHGRINPVIPLQKDFNYVVAHVRFGDEYLLLDATDPSLPGNMLPFHCLNDKGRLISPDYTTWIPLLSREINKNSAQAEMSLSPEGSLSGKVSFKHEGYEAVKSRQKYNGKGEEKYLEEEYEKTGWEISDFSINEPKIAKMELEESMNINIPMAATVAGDKIYIQPMFLYVEKESPFKLEDRKFPVDFGCPRERVSLIKIKIPEGYEVEELPEQMLLSLPDRSGTFKYIINKVGNELVLMNSFKVTKPLYLPQEYSGLKQFYDMMVAKHAEQIVLKRIAN